MVPIHLCEVAIRNAVSDALTTVYGAQWPWSNGFTQSLPNPVHSYNPSRDLLNTRHSYATTGKVIPELKFAFWEHMFTRRHDKRLWKPHLLSVLPNLDAATAVTQHRNDIHSALGAIRVLRNRIAHHEPIFSRSLSDDLDKMRTIVGHRSAEMQTWFDSMETVSTTLLLKP